MFDFKNYQWRKMTKNGEKWRKMAMANLPFSFVKFAISPLAPPPPPRHTSEFRRQYGGSTAAVRRQYCGSTAAVLRQYRGSTAAVPWQYRDNTYKRLLIQFFHEFFESNIQNCANSYQLKCKIKVFSVSISNAQYKYFPKIDDRSSSSERLGQITNEVLVIIRINDVIASVMRHS